ncbi:MULTISPECIES: Rpn family recombination-promoting nuclease/putative transposase [unclassified Microcoleus]|uniref:Rpn family recombination-promoting nuclease/putative transposase n=1 Tax=unclassified Microcoleus TaxID=2642155 RepID=UPI002FD20E6E
MNFINPKTDFAFKKIFGSADSKDILISFLNAILYEAQPVIEDLEIIDPYLAPKIKGVKDTYLDVKAKITGDKTVIIEMQVLNVESFEKRILYNAAKAYSVQLKKGDKYDLLNPVIALTITDFQMFENLETVISRFVLKEKTFFVDFLTNELEYVFVELPKFNKTLEELKTLTDKWIYFMKTARTLSYVPEELGNVPELRQAFAIANEANLEPDELEDLERREIFIQDQRGAITKATRLGMEEGIRRGIERGIEQGIKQGIEQGIEQGIKQANLRLILRLLERSVGFMSLDTQSSIAQLSAEQLQSLGEALLDFTTLSDLTTWLQAHNNRQ